MFVNNSAAAAANVDKNRQNARDSRQKTRLPSLSQLESLSINIFFFGQLNYALAPKRILYATSASIS